MRKKDKIKIIVLDVFHTSTGFRDILISVSIFSREWMFLNRCVSLKKFGRSYIMNNYLCPKKIFIGSLSVAEPSAHMKYIVGSKECVVVGKHEFLGDSILPYIPFARMSEDSELRYLGKVISRIYGERKREDV